MLLVVVSVFFVGVLVSLSGMFSVFGWLVLVSSDWIVCLDCVYLFLLKW